MTISALMEVTYHFHAEFLIPYAGLSPALFLLVGQPRNILNQGWVNFPCEGPESKYFWLCRPSGLCG